MQKQEHNENENPDTFIRLIKKLEQNGVYYNLIKHEAIITSQQAAEIRELPDGSGCKSLFLRNKKQSEFIICVLPGNQKIDSKKLRKLLKSNKFHFASSEEVEKLTGCIIGGVCPFGSLFGVQTYLEQTVQQRSIINFSCGLRTHSIQMKFKDYLKVENPQIVDLKRG